MPDILSYFETVMGHRFTDYELILEAVTHSSYANENGTMCNERLEFLGDSVLSILVSGYLFSHKPTLPEGDMTRARAAIVCEKTLAFCAKKIGLGSVLRLGKGEKLTGGDRRPSVLADAMEAVLAALYLDAGFEKARSFMLGLLEEPMREVLSGRMAEDYKTKLQEVWQAYHKDVPHYTLVEESGPDHDKRFTVAVSADGKELGRGMGRSKKLAEQAAAKCALEVLS